MAAQCAVDSIETFQEVDPFEFRMCLVEKGILNTHFRESSIEEYQPVQERELFLETRDVESCQRFLGVRQKSVYTERHRKCSMI